MEGVCEAEQEPVSAKSSPESGKEVILQFLPGVLGCQFLFRNSWTVPCQQVIQTGLIWGADVSGEGLCKGQAVARLLALGAAESEYMLQGECGQSWKGQLGWCEIGLDVYICLYLKLQPHNLFLCCFKKFHYLLQYKPKFKLMPTH